MNLTLSKVPNGFMPADQETKDFHDKMKVGEIIHGYFKKIRNPRFHRKLFALLNLAFEYWEPGEINSKYGTPEKNFDRFRKDLLIISGYYDIVIRMDGTARPEAKSISFAAMDDTEFEKLYNSVLNVILKRVNVLDKMSSEEVNELVDNVLAFG